MTQTKYERGSYDAGSLEQLKVGAHQYRGFWCIISPGNKGWFIVLHPRFYTTTGAWLYGPFGYQEAHDIIDGLIDEPKDCKPNEIIIDGTTYRRVQDE